jgi:hypothetical protein
MVKCKFREKEEFSSILSENGRKKKKGRYHRSFFPDVEGYGKTSWIIMTEIDVTDNSYSLDSTNVEEVAEGCIEYLNQPSKRKRKTKKKIKLPYGSLKLHKASIKEDGKNIYIFAHLIIDERKNKNFWSEGPVYHGGKRRKRVTSQK